MGVLGLIAGGLQIAGAAKNVLGIGRKETEERQLQYEKDKMSYQAYLNRVQGLYGNELAKSMWDYTNYENQRKHIEAAGLNPALMYGNGGGGGATSQGGNADGVSMGQTDAIAMGIQLRQMESQTALNLAQSEKVEAEAEKIKAEETKTEEETTLTKILQGLKTNEADKVFREVQGIIQDNRKKLAEANVAEATQETQIQKLEKDLEAVKEGINNIKAKTDTEKELQNKIREEAWAIAENVKNGRITAEAARQQAETMLKKFEHQQAYDWASLAVESAIDLGELIFSLKKLQKLFGLKGVKGLDDLPKGGVKFLDNTAKGGK